MLNVVLELSLLIDAFEQMENTKSRLSLTDILVSLFRKTPKDLIEKVVYFIQGKLAPDYEALDLGLAEKMAIRAIAYSSGSPVHLVEKAYQSTGDIGDAAGQIMKTRNQMTLTSEIMTVERVFSTLVKIAKTAGPGSQESKLKLLSSILNETQPQESRYILKLVMGTLRLGIADFTVLDALAIAFTGSKSNRAVLEKAYNATNDLGNIAKTLATQGLDAIKMLRITLFKPVRPMLAERVATTMDALSRMDGRGLAEYKLDGERVQVHKSSENVELFTRRLDKITHHFPDLVESMRALYVKEAILEGEVVAVDSETGSYLPFQMLMHRRRKHGINEAMENYPVVINLFDILYLGSAETTSLPLSERRALLEKIIYHKDVGGNISSTSGRKKNSLSMEKAKKGNNRADTEKEIGIIDYNQRSKLVPQVVVQDPSQVEKFMASAIENGCEGLMIKQPDSTYRAGAREYAWVKLKREYQAELADTLDLVIVGALYGRGRRVGKYGALLLAAYDGNTDQFQSTTKVGTGFTDKSLAQFFQDLEKYVLPHRHPRVDTGMKMDVWFEPRIVIEVIASEITLSPSHTAGINSLKEGFGLALRFPKFTGKIRDDKKPEDATAVEELITMYKQQSRSLSKQDKAAGK
jgi:DNA ligase 1